MAVTKARRAVMLSALWNVLRTSTRSGGPGLVDRASAVPRMLGDSVAGRYRGFGRGRVALLVLVLAYVVSPVDVVPEGLLLAAGLLDDVALATWVGVTLLGETGDYLEWEAAGGGVEAAGAGFVPGAVVDPPYATR